MAIGSLAVRVSADTKPFTKGMKRTTAPAKNLEKHINAIAKRSTIMATAVTGAGAALGSVLAVQSLNAAKEMRLMAQVAHTSTSEFARMTAGAKKVGVENDKLADILKDVNDRIGDFIQTGGGPMADFFENIAPKVRVTADQFARLSGPEALQLYVDSLEKAGVSQKDMTFYMEAMASDASNLLPLLRDGGEAMRRQGDQAERLGAVLTDIEYQRLADASDALQDVQTGLTGIRDRVMVSLSPTITAVAEQMINQFGTASGSMQENIDNVVDKATIGFAEILRGAGTVAGFVENNPDMLKYGLLGYLILGKKGAAIGAVASTLFNTLEGEMARFGVYSSSATSSLVAEIERVQSAIDSTESKIHKLSKVGSEDEFAYGGINALTAELNNLQVEKQDLIDSIPRDSAAWKEYQDLFAETEAGANSLKSAFSEMADTIENSRGDSGITISSPRIAPPDLPAEEQPAQEVDPEVIAEQNKRAKMAAIYQDYADQRMASGENFRQTDLQKQEEYQAKLAAIDTDAVQARLAVAEGMFSNLSSLMQSEYKKEFEIGKVAATAKALIDGYQAVQSSYAAGAAVGGPVLGAAFAATAAAATAMQVRKIQSTSFNGGGKSDTGMNGGGDTGPTPQPQEVTNNNTSNNVTLNVTGSGDPQSIIAALEEFFGNDGIAINSDTAQAQVLRG